MYRICCSLSLVFSILTLYAQNTPPSVTNIDVVHFPEENLLTVKYDLMHDEDVSIVLQQSISGDAFLKLDNLSGDYGDVVIPGADKEINYSYAPGLEIENISLRILAYDDHTPDIQDMVDAVDEAYIREAMDSIIGIRHHIENPDHKQKVAEYLREYIVQHNLTSAHQDFKSGVYDFQNIIGQRQGLNNSSLCLISGHYDTVRPAPGADDNGSGVVAVLEAIRVMSDYVFENNVQFTFFDLEESGLRGSGNYVDKGIQETENIVGLVNYDMIAYTSDEPHSQSVPAGFDLLFPDLEQELDENEYRGDFIINAATENSTELAEIFNTSVETYVPDLKHAYLPLPGNGQIVPDLRRSDHAHFWDKGYPAIFITDSGEFRNPHYHKSTDDLSTIDFEFLTQVTKAGIATLAAMARPLNASISTVDLSDITSFSSASANAGFKLWPNPTAETLRFKYIATDPSSQLQVEIHDASGTQVRGIHLTYEENSQYSINTRDLLPGHYILLLKDGKKKYAHTFIKALK